MSASAFAWPKRCDIHNKEFEMPPERPTIPDLPRHCGSWVIVQNGKAIQETYHRRTAQRFADNGYEVLTTLQWLDRVNRTGETLSHTQVKALERLVQQGVSFHRANDPTMIALSTRGYVVRKDHRWRITPAGQEMIALYVGDGK